ncbi:MAG: 6-bladed beta-propeller [Gemmatimonadales bacterium]
MRDLRLLVVLVLLFVPVAAPAQTAPRWPVAPVPMTRIGGSSSDESQELLGVGSARRLADGRVLVANGKPREMRIYSAQGKFLSRIGREGGGPGEFAGRIDIITLIGDTIVVFDQGSLRWSRFLASGKLVDEAKAGPAAAPAQVALYRRSIVRDLPPSLGRCATLLLDAIPPVPIPSLREVLPDGVGRFWLHTDSSTTWSVHAASGKLLGTVQFPAGVELYQVGAGFAVGRLRDADEVEQVVVFRVATPPPPSVRPACAGNRDSLPGASGPRVTELKTILRNSLTAGEMAYSNLAHYVGTADSLTLKLGDDMVFRVLRASNRGWAGAVFDRRTSLVCMFGLGDATPVGWPEGMMRCGP